jgi:hypothetical protein
VNELPLESFQAAIHATHGGKATFLRRERVTEQFQGQTAWDGEVLVFALKQHATTSLCYAWSVDGRVTAVLHQPPVDSPQAAVRAAIVAEHRKAE